MKQISEEKNPRVIFSEDNVTDVPKHAVMLYFENMIYKFFIPRYAPDEAIYITRSIK